MQLLTNYGPIVWFLIFAPIALWIDRSGARAPCVFSTACLFGSSLTRVFARDASRTSIILLHASFVLNALAGPIATAASSKLAEDWFPSGAARTTATSIMAEVCSSRAASCPVSLVSQYTESLLNLLTPSHQPLLIISCPPTTPPHRPTCPSVSCSFFSFCTASISRAPSSREFYSSPRLRTFRRGRRRRHRRVHTSSRPRRRA